MIARLHSKRQVALPLFDNAKLRTESDVEQKLLFPFLTHASFLALPESWIRTKEYMTPTEIDKAAGKRYGYVPDYSVWLKGIPLLIVEAKAPDVAIEVGLREARLYAGEINKRYPPQINPIGFVFASNGDQFGLSEWDSEVETLIVPCIEAAPGSEVLQALQNAIGKFELDKKAEKLAAHFQYRNFYRVAEFMGGQARLNQQLGVNEFAEPLFPTLTKYFGTDSDLVSDEIVDRAYVASDELTTYEGVLETYLKDRVTDIAGNLIKPIDTSKKQATGISTEIQKFASNPVFYSRVQLIIGSVGAGKSLFIQRFYRRLMSKEVAERTRWAFINFNVMPPGHDDLQNWISEQFIASFSKTNNVDLDDLKQIEKIFATELKRFEKGPAKPLKTADNQEYLRRRASLLDELVKDAPKFAECITRHFSGERRFGIVIVFDNVDRRSREKQLLIFESAQWFKDITRALLLINLRDSTFETHKDEPPLDAFINAINFYVRPPRFSQVIRKRLELVLEALPKEVAKQQEYTLTSGYKIRYPASRLGEFLMGIYLSLFHRRTVQVAAALEGLVAKDVRRALAMFGDIIVSPHIPTNQITGAALTAGEFRLQEYRIIRALMRGRYKYFNGRSAYVRNILSADLEHNRPSNLLNADILEFLIRNRKSKIDFTQEGYAAVETVIKKMGRLGYDEQDSFDAIHTLVTWGLIEPESLVSDSLDEEDAIRVHASGFMHMRFFIERSEYLIGITTNLQFVSRNLAIDVGALWSGQEHRPDLSLHSKRRLMRMLRNYIAFEYERRCKRHPFYEEDGFGGRVLLRAVERATDHINNLVPAQRKQPAH